MILLPGTISDIPNPSGIHSIVSLVPSISWYLYDLGLDAEIAGVTRFCLSPSGLRNKAERIGGTKDPKIERIISLQPDLILANREENRKEDIERLAQDHTVYLSEVKDLEGMYEMMQDIAILTSKNEEGSILVNQIQKRVEEFEKVVYGKTHPKVLYLIWKDPLMSIGKDTFIHHMLEQAGFQNAMAHHSRYPELRIEDLTALDPDFIFLSSEPYPFKERHKSHFSPYKSILVDGQMFSWYGSFILKSFDYLDALNKCLSKGI
ncbi:MAG TPA: helical backbone metal receptor [Saprospiraceae bacterium]|nr:helical backbone metal receptor [Saprospiraceae bacterium]